MEKSSVFLVLAEPFCALLRRFVFKFFEILVPFLLLFAVGS